MGKCMRKDKVTGDVVLMEVSTSSLGVRTRAKTLALQRLQSSPPTAASSPPPSSNPNSCYLELRSRRLVKIPPPPSTQNSRRARQTRNDGEFTKIASVPGAIEAEDGEIEPCFGENTTDCRAMERGTRESTPCSLIRAAISTPPGSTTKRSSCSNAAARRTTTPSAANIPTMPELEELFAHEERSQQHLFIQKYNFDIVNDMPLPGRFEWVTVRL